MTAPPGGRFLKTGAGYSRNALPEAVRALPETWRGFRAKAPRFGELRRRNLVAPGERPVGFPSLARPPDLATSRTVMTAPDE
jgi:hypothetical protein